MDRYRIVFEYADTTSGWRWAEQECVLYGKNIEDAKSRCMELYGLGVDCDFHIIIVELV